VGAERFRGLSTLPILWAMGGGTDFGSWDDAYQHNRTPWDIGRPQPAFVHIADNGGFIEPVLDSGCGSGEHALLAASMGLVAKGVSQTAIERARAKARARGLLAEFIVGDVLALAEVPRLEPPFRTVIDMGCFHTFSNADRVLYARSLASVTEPGALLHLLCFSEHTPGTDGPRRVTQGEIIGTFSRDWDVESIEPDVIAVSSLWNGPEPSAWLARMVRR
jgi:SAM-dependent methyltransferase